MLAALLALRFLFELGALAGLAWWGAGAGHALAADLALGLGVPLAVAALWGALIAPRSPRRLPDPERLLAEFVVYAAATLAIAAAGAAILGAAFGAAAFATALAVRALGGESPGP